MELQLPLGQRTAPAAFRRLIADCSESHGTTSVVHYLVLAALELVRKPARLEQLNAKGGGPTGTVFVGDYAFVVTPAAVCAGHAGLCKKLLLQGKCVVWLVARKQELKAMRLLRSYRLSRRVEVRPLEDFLALRTLFSSWDLRSSEHAAARLIVNRCNELLRRRRVEMEISVS